MDHNALAQQRREDAAAPAQARHVIRPPAQYDRPIARRPSHPSPGKIRNAKDSSEIIRNSRKMDTPTRSGAEDDSSARHFTVANVGKGGTLYLKPSRIAPGFAKPPVTPPDTADGERGYGQWPSARPNEGNTSTWGSRFKSATRGGAHDNRIPVPPLSMSNVQPRRRARSQSFSTISDHIRSPTFDSNDFAILLNGQDTSRPKSSVDLSGGLLDLQIPHYRIGTPRFSERGTAYLHNSIYTTTTDDMRSSVFSRAEYDKLFPVPPGASASVLPPRKDSSPYLHPAQAARTPSRTPPLAKSPGATGAVGLTTFDRIEANPDDPSIVRYHSATGRIAAATPARLVAQITSPNFLDYELLSDFFLTYRSFMSSRNLLEYLTIRLRWALGANTDAGRIVRVRTFVALRHWILNYFSDDFLPNADFRQQFCDLVNELAQELLRRRDRGGSDIKIIGELKKCWRRTCAQYFPTHNALDISSETDIVAGDDRASFGGDASALSLPLPPTAKPSKADFRRISTVVQISTEVEQYSEPIETYDFARAGGPTLERRGTTRTASIPASPMSEDSLHVLSCSIPFLRTIRPSNRRATNARPVGPQRNPPLSGKERPNHQHKRSGSFTDALRDQRFPLPSNKAEAVDVRALSTVTFTGGLVRGLLLQPSPANVDVLVPLSPSPPKQTQQESLDAATADHQQMQNLGVRRIVGDMRRALSSRKGVYEPNRTHRPTGSGDSAGFSNRSGQNRPAQPSAWQELRGPARMDVLGLKVETSYRQALEGSARPASPQKSLPPREDSVALPESPLPSPSKNRQFGEKADFARFNSGVTDGTRSIVIVDDTRVPDLPTLPGALPSPSTLHSDLMPRSLFRRTIEDAYTPNRAFGHTRNMSSRGNVSAEGRFQRRRHSSDAAVPNFPTPAQNWRVTSDQDTPELRVPSAYDSARKSSSVNASPVAPPPAGKLLRRRPGGDLKAADHVHELEPAPRLHRSSSFTSFSLSGQNSGVPSHELSGTHFSGQDFNTWRFPTSSMRALKMDSVALLDTHSSQQNLRPSFEAQVSKLAQIGDVESGGIEDALMRLEGRVSNRSLNEAGDPPTVDASEMESLSKQASTARPRDLADNTTSRGASTSMDDTVIIRSPQTETQGASIYHLSVSEGMSSRHKRSGSYGIESYIAGSEAGGLPRQSGLGIISSPPMSPSTPVKRAAMPAQPMNETSIDSPRGRAVTSSHSKPSTSQGSFLLDDNESLSDISTEIADQTDDENLGVRSFFFDDTIDDDDDVQLPYRPPPTPPSTVGAGEHSPERGASVHRLQAEARRLKEVSSAPKLLSPHQDQRDRQFRPQSTLTTNLRRVKTSLMPDATAHLPFVLAFESDVVAEQLTIIEKDALDEVDWKDLVALNWRQAAPHVRNWVEYLKQDNSNGIDTVVARFNLVVKWVVSECVLTDAPDERARCITKFIHIASHCHRLHNYASTYQIVLALLSSDLARLHRTWSLVAPSDKQILSALERLCEPIRNFHNLRTEMESSSLANGCIPFIGLYTHDLMFNAQKPVQIECSGPPALSAAREPLVNFERFQTAAIIVKSLLRLIEASSKYVFRPHPEVLSRCLWLAALEDREIHARSRGLERDWS